MATLYIAEYTALGMGGGAQIPKEPPIAEQTIAISGSSTQCTNPFQTATKFIRVETDSTCSILIGINPTATNTNQRFAQNQCEYKDVTGLGGTGKIAVIQNS